MGMFNTVWSEQKCPFCKQPLEVGVQFKYGWMKLADYRLGDRVEWQPWPARPGVLQTRWHEMNGGRPGHTRVLVEGHDNWTQCTACGAKHWPEPYCWFTVSVERDVISEVRPWSEADPWPNYDYVVVAD